ncbi:hypothetical protein BCR35DRAFT_119311 [Leucosporidium creatinivorum]|uniref:Uncharacterized protein n=1 Tax=Leucosporidium creatinivorum TaxID=106004 RepID=A0A1Y2F0R7_9BASI|nr:hypothetical protein BCR35DRAFT_119311 [Leucosporidium creatinivorum]
MPRWLPGGGPRSRVASPCRSTQDAPSTSHTPSSVPNQHPLESLNLNTDLWPSFSPPSTTNSAAAPPWTLSLGLPSSPSGGLSPPPRARRASARSLGIRGSTTPSGGTPGGGGHPLRRVRSLESSSASSTGRESSAGSGSGAVAARGGGEQFVWRPRAREVDEDESSDQISSPGTFGGEGDRRRGGGGGESISTASARTGTGGSRSSGSVMPRSLLSASEERMTRGSTSREWSEWGSSPRTGGGMSLGPPPPRSRERMRERERRDVSGGTTGTGRTFDERSWEFKVAEAIFLSSPARTPSSSSISPSSNASPSTAASSTARLPNANAQYPSSPAPSPLPRQ